MVRQWEIYKTFIVRAITMLSEIILDRAVNGIIFECGYHRATTTGGDPMPAFWDGEHVTTFFSITEARKAFWNAVLK